MSADVRDLLLALVPIDTYVTAWCAAQCARTALRYVPAGEERPRLAIEATEQWAREPTGARREQLFSTSQAAYNSYDDHSRTALGASAWASRAAAAAANWSARWVAYGGDRVVKYCADYAAAAFASTSAHPNATRAQALLGMHTLCLSQCWPLTPLSPEQRSRLRPSHQVALDYLDECDLPETLTVGQLIEAYKQRGALLWSTSTGRAIAERLVLVDEARRIRGVEIVNYGGAP